MCVLASHRLNSPRGIVSSMKNESEIVGNSFLAPAVSTKDKKPSCCWDGGCDLRIARSKGYTRSAANLPKHGGRASCFLKKLDDGQIPKKMIASMNHTPSSEP